MVPRDARVAPGHQKYPGRFGCSTEVSAISALKVRPSLLGCTNIVTIPMLSREFLWLSEKQRTALACTSRMVDGSHQPVTIVFVIRHLAFALWTVLACGTVSAQTNVWKPSPGHAQIPIWPSVGPAAPTVTGPEAVLSNADWVVAGKPFRF